MKVATNMFGAESADLIVDANKRGLNLIGIICPFITLDALWNLLKFSNFTNRRIITEISTVDKWQKLIKRGLMPEKEERREFSLDWIQIIGKKENPHLNHNDVTPADWNESIYFLKGVVDGRDFKIEVHTQPQYDIHAKLYVYDGGFVITSGNITYAGTITRHMELGILITKEDDELEVQVIRELFETNWVDKSLSCEAIRRRIRYVNFAEELLNMVLSNEIEENGMRHHNEIGDNMEYITDYKRDCFSGGLLCFGCDEGRYGRVVKRDIEINGGNYTEIVCKGCDRILKKIRSYLPEFVQDRSHEGYIHWRISNQFYMNNEPMLKKFYHSCDENTVALCGSDDGTMDELIKTLVACKLWRSEK